MRSLRIAITAALVDSPAGDAGAVSGARREDDARLAGDLIDSKDLVSNGQPLPSLIPPINIHVPKAWVTRRKG